MKVIYVGKSGDHWFMIRYEDGKARVWATRWGEWAAKELAEGHPLARSGVFRQGLTLPQVVNDAGQQRTLDEPVTEGWVYG